MRQVRWIDASVANLFASSSEVKRPAIQELFRTYPQRQFVLVGDSGENDPELYGALSRAHPRQVAGIFIRDVGRGTNPERLDKAFEGVTRRKWQVFEDGQSLAAAAEGLFAGSK
jgi:phosphatidate phosphatase APP1